MILATERSCSTFSNRGAIHAAILGATLLGLAPVSIAQSPPTRERSGRLVQVGAELPTVPTLPVVINHRRTGDAPEEGGIAGSCPDVIRTWSSANFGGGTFVVQAGFAEQEMAAASYTIPAAAFPIKVELMEMIFATSNATMSTTTKWSILVYDGPPNTGTVVASYSSDDIILPHIHLGPGTNGVNVSVSVDPGDPKQIFVFNNSGTGIVTIAYRIDDHHQQTANPCTTAPPNCCNAFPTTDTGGLQAGANNWLFGLNCGSFGCPPNGGWSTFNGLNVFCRPSGDWNIRLTYSSVNCVATGACCLTNGSCSPDMTQSACASAGGNYRGDNSPCITTTCQGACCVPQTQGCAQTTLNNCQLASGVFQGIGTQCAQVQCFIQGACCFTNGSCTPNMLQLNCNTAGGVFHANQTCPQASCPQPIGACCLGSSCLSDIQEGDCITVFQGTWQGQNSTCGPTTCTAPCVGDIAPPGGNDFVNTDDLLVVINSWGPCGGCPADIAPPGGNAFVNTDDLLVVINNWGPCR